MDFDRYANVAGEQAADLVNLLVADAAGDPDESPRESDVRRLLRHHDLDLPVASGTVDDYRVLASDLHDIFLATDLDEAIDVLNRLLADTPMAPRVSTHGDRGPHLHVEPAAASTVVRLRANCLMGLAAVLCDGGRLRVGTCDAHDCGRVFVDTSRNARRRFCTSTCSTRHHVAAHRARRHG